MACGDTKISSLRAPAVQDLIDARPNGDTCRPAENPDLGHAPAPWLHGVHDRRRLPWAKRQIGQHDMRTVGACNSQADPAGAHLPRRYDARAFLTVGPIGCSAGRNCVAALHGPGHLELRSANDEAVLGQSDLRVRQPYSVPRIAEVDVALSAIGKQRPLERTVSGQELM